MKKTITHLITYTILITSLFQYLILNDIKKANLNIKIEKDTIQNYVILNNNKKLSLTDNNKNKILQINSNKSIFLNKNELNTNKNFILIKKKKCIKLLSKKTFKKFLNIKNIGKITSNLKLTNNEMFFNINDNEVLVFDILNNKIKWQTITNANSFNVATKAKLILSCDKIYQIIPNSKLVILNKYTGEILTNKNIKINNSPEIKTIKKTIINKNLIYICYNDGSFIKLDGNDGTKLWQKTKNNYKNFSLIKNKIIIIKNNGNITILNSKTGKKIITNRSLNGKKINIKSINKKLNIAIIKEFSGTTHLINTKTGIIIYSFRINKNNIKYIKNHNNLIGIKDNKKIFKISITK